MKYKIYILYDPIKKVVGYVGCTKQPLRARLLQHFVCAKKGSRSGVYVWLKTLLDENRTPRIKQIDEHELLEDALEAECDWISYYKNKQEYIYNTGRSTPVLCIETTEIYPSMRAAAKKYGVVVSAIFSAIKNGHLVGGHHWRYR